MIKRLSTITRWSVCGLVLAFGAVQSHAQSTNAPAAVLRLAQAEFYLGHFSAASSRLADPVWNALPDIGGDGTVKTIGEPAPSQSQFYRVLIH